MFEPGKPIVTLTDAAATQVRALMDHLDLPSTARASVGVYTRPEDFDALANALEKVRRIFG